MNKYEFLKQQLEKLGTVTMKCFGQSMTDIVFCKVKGRYIDANKITKINSDGKYMIANNHGFENGWTNTIYGKVIKAKFKKEENLFE